MSLILEALRKSEAERRRGQAPDLLSEPLAFAPGPRATTRSVPRWAYAAAVIGLVALAAWWAWPRAAATTAAGTNAGAETLARQDNPSAVDNPAPGPARQSASVDSSSSPTAPAPALANATAGRMPAAPLQSADVVDRAAASVDVVPRSSPPADPRPMPTTARTAAADTSDTPAEIPAAPAPTRSPAAATALPAPAPDLARAGTPPAALPAAPPSFTSPDRTLRLADLSTEDRQQLPPLKMSMHMFGAAAAQRFAIIDGNRVGEGDRVGEALVDTIEADGVTLSWRGRRIRLPVR